MVAEFDSIADIYDSTREPATDAEISAISDALKGCETVLDVGVGTGRFAKPLSELGFHVTGVDISSSARDILVDVFRINKFFQSPLAPA